MHLHYPVEDIACVPSLQYHTYMEDRIKNVKAVLRRENIDFEARCTSSTEDDCWLLGDLMPWNKILCFGNMQLKEHKPGRLQLSELNSVVSTCHESGSLLDATFVTYWLIKKHCCVDYFKPSAHVVGQSSRAFVDALTSNSSLCHFEYCRSSSWPLEDFYVPEGVCRLKNVESLVLSNVEVRHKGAVLIAKMLEDNTRIKKVNFTSNSLSRCSSETILRALRKCTMLTELVFDSNRIQEKAMKYLGHLVARSPSLEKVALSNCLSSEDSGIESLANALKVNTTVKVISFYGCRFGVDKIADALKENKGVRRAMFLECSIQDENCSKLARMLEQNSALEELHLTSNNIRDYGATVLSAGLRGNKTLKKLYVNENVIGNRGMERLIEALATNESIQLLDITSNSLDERSGSTVSRALISARAYGRVRLDWQDVDIAELAIALASGNEIEDLELDCDSLSSEKVLQVLEALIVNTSVKELKMIVPLMSPYANSVAKVIATNKSIKSLLLRPGNEQPDYAVVLRALESNRTITKCRLDVHENEGGIIQALASVVKNNKTISDLDIHALCGSSSVKNISKALSANYTITRLNLNTDARQNKSAFRIRKLLHRNFSLLNAAARFVLNPSVHKDRARTFEKLAHSDSLVEHLVDVTSKSEGEVKKLLRSAKEYITVNYFQIVGVVKTKVECCDDVEHRGQIDQLNEVCFRTLLSYLRIDDVVAV